MYYHGTWDSFDVDYGNDVNLFANGVTGLPSGSPVIGAWTGFLSEYTASTGTMSASTSITAEASFNRSIQPGPVAGHALEALKFDVLPGFGPLSGWDAVPTARLSIPVNTDVSFGPNNKCVYLWLKTANPATVAPQTIAGIYDVTTRAIDWLIQIQGNTLIFGMGDGAGGFQFCTVGFSDTSLWHLLVCWYDSVANVIHMNLDNGASVASQAITLIPVIGSLPLTVGGATNSATGAGAEQYQGLIDEMVILNGNPTVSDIAAIWA